MTTRREPTRRNGFALVSAIFLLVVLAALGAFMATVTTLQHAGSALDVAGTRAYYAARTGIDWGAARTADAAFCSANPSTTIAVGALSVTVECATVAAGNPVEPGLVGIYALTATACNEPGGGSCPGAAAAANYVERRMTALLER